MLQTELKPNSDLPTDGVTSALELPGETLVEQPAGFLGLSTQAPTTKTLFNDLGELSNVATKWEVETYRSSNLQLYQILARCYQIHAVLNADGAKALRNQFKSYLTYNKATIGGFKETTPLLQRVVCVAFPNASAQRVSIYTKALKAAATRNYPHEQISSFLITAGGVEAAAANVTPEDVLKQKEADQAKKIETIEANIKSIKPLTTITAPELQEVKAPEGNQDQEHFLFIATRKSLDTFDIVGVVNSGALVKAAKEKWYADNKETLASSAATVNAFSQQDAMADAIKNASKPLLDQVGPTPQEILQQLRQASAAQKQGDTV